MPPDLTVSSSGTATPGVIGRVGWVDAAKGFCILLVVAGHAVNNLNNNGYLTGEWERINLMLGPMRMPLFFLLSGLFAAKALSENWRSFADRRVWIMVWLFVLWVPVREIWLAMVPATSVGHDGPVPAPRAADPVNWGPMLENMGRAVLGPESYLWFVYALALFAVLSKLTRKVPPVVQLLLAGAVSVTAPTANFGWPWNDILHTYFFYLLGMYGAPWIHRMAQRRSLPLIAVSITVYTVLALWIDATYAHFNFGLSGPVRLFLATVGIIAAIGVFSYMESWRVTVPFSKVGSRTLPVFLMHIMVLATVTFVLDLVLPADPGLPLQPLILGGIAVVLSLGLHWVLTACGLTWLFRRPAWTRRRFLAAGR
ncbi:acyltransferase family protein [Corynebacterium kalidii]|uniref:Acyltransferase family protein n=1 Tax=Corynebacterium kalidii TaxID=2931982 RepID=A0A9X1WIN3_9CORY|nr:acyltransferase family protein [Corynebacterium kalidii]